MPSASPPAICSSTWNSPGWSLIRSLGGSTSWTTFTSGQPRRSHSVPISSDADCGAAGLRLVARDGDVAEHRRRVGSRGRRRGGRLRLAARRAGGCGRRRAPRTSRATAAASSSSPSTSAITGTAPTDEDPDRGRLHAQRGGWRGRVPRRGTGRRCALLVAATGTAAQQRERPAPDDAGRVDLLAALEALHCRARERSEQPIHGSRPGTGPLQAPLDLTDALRSGRAAEARPERDRSRGPAGRPAAAGGRGC